MKIIQISTTYFTLCQLQNLVLQSHLLHLIFTKVKWSRWYYYLSFSRGWSWSWEVWGLAWTVHLPSAETSRGPKPAWLQVFALMCCIACPTEQGTLHCMLVSFRQHPLPMSFSECMCIYLIDDLWVKKNCYRGRNESMMTGKCCWSVDHWRYKEFGYNGSVTSLHLPGMQILGRYNEATSCGGQLLNGQGWGGNTFYTKWFVVKYLPNTVIK